MSWLPAREVLRQWDLLRWATGRVVLPGGPGQAVAALLIARSAEGQQDEAPRTRVDELATHRGADADAAVGPSTSSAPSTSRVSSPSSTR
jgi:hypothetical protein